METIIYIAIYVIGAVLGCITSLKLHKVEYYNSFRYKHDPKKTPYELNYGDLLMTICMTITSWLGILTCLHLMGTYSGFWEKSIGKSKKLLMICILTTGVALSAHAQTYKYNKGDTVYNKHTKLTYVIDSVQVRKHNKQAFYYATDVFTKQQVQWLPENSLIKP